MKKIFLIHQGEIALAYSGKKLVFERFKRRIRGNRNITKAKKLHSAVETMEDVISGIRQEYLDKKAYDSDEQLLEVLVCGLDGLKRGKPELYKLSQRGRSELVDRESEQYYLTGHGCDIAESLLRLFYSPNASKSEIVDIIAYVVLETGKVDSTVGGDPYLVVVEPDRKPELLTNEEIRRISEKVDLTRNAVRVFFSKLFTRSQAFTETVAKLMSDDMSYSVFEEQFVKELGGVTRSNHEVNLSLTPSLIPETALYQGIVTSKYEAHNKSNVDRALFCLENVDDVVYKGRATLPPSLAKPPKKPSDVWDLVTQEGKPSNYIMIDGQAKQCKKTVSWASKRDHSKGVRYKISLHDTIRPDKTKLVSWSYKCLYHSIDFLIRRFGSYGNQATVTVHKPENLDVYLSWFLFPRKKPPYGVKILDATSSPTEYNQTAEGVINPGSGFVIIWQPRIVK